MSDNAPDYATDYNRGAKIFHWLIALSILFMLGLGWWMGETTGAEKFRLFQLHKSVGITILLLSVLRLGWRLVHRVPPLPDHLPKWQRQASGAVHFALYFFMIVMPFSGWVIVSASSLNIPTVLFGVVPWPHLPIIPELVNKKEIGHMAGETHETLALILAIMIVLHVGAALQHHFIHRDDILLRMTPKFLHKFMVMLRGGR